MLCRSLRILQKYIFTMKIVFLASLLNSCGPDEDNSADISYYLERTATNLPFNTLVTKVADDLKYKFSLSGQGINAEIPLNEITELRDRTMISTPSVGKYTLLLTIHQFDDEVPIIKESLSWEYSTEPPPIPTIFFSEPATSDENVIILVPSAKGENTKEIWVEGDLESISAKGQWYDIPETGQVPIKVSEGDGVKSFKLKYRNIFGTEGEESDAEILRKSTPPQGCKAVPFANTLATSTLPLNVYGTDELGVWFKVTGDVAVEKDYIRFDDFVKTSVTLSSSTGNKNITVKIKDIAGNHCDDINLSIVVDPNHSLAGVSIKDGLIWTDTPSLTILPRYDHFEEDAYEMYIEGGVVDDDNTFKWLPFTTEVPVTLSPSSGTRHIIVRYRHLGVEVAEVSVPIFLRPYILVSGGHAVVNITPAEIIGTKSITVVGCQERYDNIQFDDSISCTKDGSEVSVTWHLSDETSITRSTSF